MIGSKKLFKSNVISASRSQGIVSGTVLSKLTKEKDSKGLEKTYCNDLLNQEKEPINFSLDKADAIASALNIPLYELISPKPFIGNQDHNQLNLEALKDAITVAGATANRQGITHVDFESSLAAYLYYAEINNLPDHERYAEVVRLTRLFFS